MWITEFEGRSTASPAEVFGVLVDATRWREWNPGVARIDLDGEFVEGARLVMVLPDGTALPFEVTRLEPDRLYEDLTEVPDAGVRVRVAHALERLDDGTRIVYRCEVDGAPEVAAEVGAAVTEDFPEVIAALAGRAERLRG